MTGWRVGYLCAPKELCDAALKIHQYIMLCAPVMGQVGALEALRSAEEDKNSMVNEYRLRRNMFVAGLNRIGLTCHVPEGAFYAFPSVKGTGLSDVEFVERITSDVPMQSQEKIFLRRSVGWRLLSADSDPRILTLVSSPFSLLLTGYKVIRDSLFCTSTYTT
jgi:histidinol-phosphate/aromatic aminotransferase/cobyric acid decarboxylase-like protein